ncbi:hypothetical protein Lal_00043979 [Lupinus albus]|uniref:Putative transcription factor C2H2 family n=1 Tax=Lupinus albus TaxID=3870 RepID=A0A6A4P0I2_LUPAL|nr:putative transcription factor C2H2 family [Lupinus albus]KAF1895333.1 hypothetical protein Lal_00043979 [Lupinus albus]
MATATNPQPPPQQLQTLNLESLSGIDSTTLSQSEIHALSLCSLSTFDLRSTRHIVTPTIDPSFFNESSGTHRQTYSRRRRLPATDDVVTDSNTDNRRIIDYLKQLIREDPKFDQIELLQPCVHTEVVAPIKEVRVGTELGLVRKRKRGRKPKVKVNLDECYRGIQIVNKNGVAIDFSALAVVEDPYAEELRRKTEGLKSEEELLGFLRDLEGQWGSRRRKRKIVDAASFGDVLPCGWKLLLGLKRKDGRAWIYCRRYLSPTGQQFLSCKEVSSYLQSLSTHSDTQLQISLWSENMLQEDRMTIKEHTDTVTIENSAGVTLEDQNQLQIVVANSDVPCLSVSNERLKEVALLGIDNLADVQIHDLFECHKCNLSFDEKDTYLQHLLSVHQRTTRRYRLGSSVGDGVIIKDGKFECQFCHKVFQERRRYNGHVGIHVRNYVRKVEDSPGLANVQMSDNSPVREEIHSRISKMDALIEIAQNSIMEPHTSAELNLIPPLEISVDDLDQDINMEFPICEQRMKSCLTGKNVVEDLNQQDYSHLLGEGEVEEIDVDNQVIDAKMVTCLDNMGLFSVNEQNGITSNIYMGKDDVELTVEGFDQYGIDLKSVSQIHLFHLSGNHMIPESEKNEDPGSCTNAKCQFKLDGDSSNKSELNIGFDGCMDVPVSINVQSTMMPASLENAVHSRDSKQAISTKQYLDCFPLISSDKGGKQYCTVDHEYDNTKGFQELRSDEIDLQYNFASGQNSLSLLDVTTELANDTVMEGMHSSPILFESQEVTIKMGGRNQLTAACVWCGIDFNHDAVDYEIQPDSVGFMCPACKGKISGQINVMDSGSLHADHI